MQMQPPKDFDTEIILTSVGAGFLNSAVSRPEAERASSPLGRGMGWLHGQSSTERTSSGAQNAALHAGVIQKSWDRNSVKNLSKVLKNPSLE